MRSGCGARGQADTACSRAVRASCLPALRPACEVRRYSGRVTAGSARVAPQPAKPGPDRTKGPHTPWQEPRWNAGRRARPTADGSAQAAHFVARPARRCVRVMKYCDCRRSASLFSF